MTLSLGSFGLAMRLGAARGGYRGAAIFLLAGQSNMVGGNIAFDGGAGYPSNTKQWGRYGADDGVLVDAVAGEPLQHWGIDEGGSFPNNGKMGIANQFAIDFAARTGRQVIFVPAAKGNTGFANGWSPTGTALQTELYDDAISRVNACIAEVGASGRFEAVLWHQGEYEASARDPSAHEANLKALVDAFRANITGATPETPFVLGGLLPQFITNGGYSATQSMLAGFPEVRALTGFASSDGTTSGDSVHFDAASLRTMGGRYDVALKAAQANAAQVPGAVENLNATPDDTEMALAWDVPSDTGGRDVSDYIVRYRVNGDTDWITFSDGTSTSTSATVTGLTNGTSYDFQISAVNAQGEGATSETTATPAVPVTPLTINAFDSAGVELAPASSHTFSSMTVSAGTVIVGIVNGNFNSPSAVTIGGQTASQIGTSGVVANHNRAFWIATGVTGTTADVAITFTGNTSACGIAVWSLPSSVVAGDCTFYADSVQSSSADSPAYAYEIAAAMLNGGVLLAYAGGFTSSAPVPTWSGATQRLAVTAYYASGDHAAADHIATTNEAARDVTLGWGTVGNGVGLIAVAVEP